MKKKLHKIKHDKELSSRQRTLFRGSLSQKNFVKNEKKSWNQNFVVDPTVTFKFFLYQELLLWATVQHGVIRVINGY